MAESDDSAAMTLLRSDDTNYYNYTDTLSTTQELRQHYSLTYKYRTVLQPLKKCTQSKGQPSKPRSMHEPINTHNYLISLLHDVNTTY